MIALAALSLAACLSVGAGSDHVLAADLAPAFPGLETIAPDTVLSFAPVPGATRVFFVPELRQIAGRFNLAAPETELCVQRPVHPLDAGQLLDAMRKEIPGADIAILDFSHQPAPEGAVEFHIGELRKGQAAALWSGYIRYAPNRRFAIWAKVKVSVKGARVVAVGDLRPGTPVMAGQVMVDARDEFPDSKIAQSLEEVTGRWPRTLIRAGSEIRVDALENPKDVMRGETVRVLVQNGGARLELDGQAEASGSIGDSVLVRNTESNKRFLAHIDGKGHVSVNGPEKMR